MQPEYLKLDLNIMVDTGNVPRRLVLREINMDPIFVPLWKNVDVYRHLYLMQDVKGIDIGDDLTRALIELTANPDEYRNAEAPSGGAIQYPPQMYFRAIRTLALILQACINYPNAKIGRYFSSKEQLNE